MRELRHPWPPVHGQDRKSRQRCTKPRRQYGLSGATSLLSLGYLFCHTRVLLRNCPIKKHRGVAKPDFHLCIPCRSEYSQTSFCLRTQLQISNPDELVVRPYRYLFDRVPPQPNCPPAGVPRMRWALSQQMSSITYFAPSFQRMSFDAPTYSMHSP